MTVLSKLNNTKLKTLTCQDIFHPNYNCWKSFWIDAIQYFPSNMKLFLPIILIPLLLRIKKLNYNLIKNSLYQYLGYTISGYIMGLGVTVNSCILRTYLKRFHIYTIAFIPGILSGLPIYFYSSKTVRLIAISLMETCLEIIIRKKSDPISQIIGNSKYIQTLIFMICNSIILHLIQKNQIKILWFMRPPKINYISLHIKIDENENVKKIHCQHNENCKKYFLNGIKTYTTIGITLDIIKFISSIISEKKLKNILTMENMKLIKFNSTKFLTASVILYRTTNCLLNKSLTTNSLISNQIAAFLGGSAYIFNPNLTFLSYAICISIEIIWKSFKLKKSESKVVNKFKNIAWDRILIPFGLGMITHFFFFENRLVSTFGKNFVNGTTNFKAARVHQRILNIIN